ncbi:MAG TPA: hypothetical protein VF912_09285 [Anaeromyxobacter sp.]
MTDDRRREDAFFGGEARGGAASADGGAEPPPRRRSSLFARNPIFALVALAFCGWLLVDFWPDVAYFFSSREPIDLGGPGAYRLELALENRLAQVRGDLAQAVPVTEARTGTPRTVGRLAGTSLVVDRPGRGGPPVFEGRILPARSRADYGEAVAAMRERGAQLGDRWLVLRDGDRPRKKWLPVVASAILALLALVNLRALLKRLAA